MVVDVGGGTTEVAVISLGGIVVSESVRTGGYELDDAVAAYIRRVLRPGDRPADGGGHQGRARLGVAAASTSSRSRSAAATSPPACRAACGSSSAEVRDALAEPVQAIVDAVKETLERTPPELAADIAQEGIVLAGGGVLLQGFAERIAEETGMPTRLADSPLTCVAVGSGMALEEFDAMVASDRMSMRGGGNRRRTAAVG